MKAVRKSLRTAYLLTMVVVLLMGAQAVLGLLFQAQYRDADWITATWFGNDWFTLVVAVPMFVGALVFADRGSIRGLLLWVGMLAYGELPVWGTLAVLTTAAVVVLLSHVRREHM